MHAQPLLYGAAPRSAKHGVAAARTPPASVPTTTYTTGAFSSQTKNF